MRRTPPAPADAAPVPVRSSGPAAVTSRSLPVAAASAAAARLSRLLLHGLHVGLHLLLRALPSFACSAALAPAVAPVAAVSARPQPVQRNAPQAVRTVRTFLGFMVFSACLVRMKGTSANASTSFLDPTLSYSRIVRNTGYGAMQSRLVAGWCCSHWRHAPGPPRPAMSTRSGCKPRGDEPGQWLALGRTWHARPLFPA